MSCTSCKPKALFIADNTISNYPLSFIFRCSGGMHYWEAVRPCCCTTDFHCCSCLCAGGYCLVLIFQLPSQMHVQSGLCICFHAYNWVSVWLIVFSYECSIIGGVQVLITFSTMKQTAPGKSHVERWHQESNWQFTFISYCTDQLCNLAASW